MFASLASKTIISPVKVTAAKRPRRQAIRQSTTSIRASSSRDDKASDQPSRRDVLALPGLAALTAGISEQLWLPGSALAKSPAKAKAAGPGIKAANVAADNWTTDLSFLGPPSGPVGGAVGCKDYAQFKPVIYGFIDGIKSGECPPFAKDATRGFLLREEGGNRVMLTLLTPAGTHKDALAFFIDSGPKANPLWAEANDTWRDPSIPITATASTAFLLRGAPPGSMKGSYFGQYTFGWNGKIEDWSVQFASPEANDFHNSAGIPFSVAHEMDLKSPGNTYKTKGKHGIEVFHLFNSKAGTEVLAEAFKPTSPFFVNEPRYAGPFESVVWKIEDDITFKA